MSLPLFIVDAFASRPFSGNPAAICVLDHQRPVEWMQALAAEMNLSETAFLLAAGTEWKLRWFTPKMEVDLCGHATLASAHVLWQSGKVSLQSAAVFQTRSGKLTCARREGWIEMDFPSEPAENAEAPAGLLEALNTQGRIVGRKRNRMDFLVEVEDERTVRSMKPDFAKLAGQPVRGVIVTARSDDANYDFVSRFFAPAAGIDEDPVTGSAHCCLGPYWAQKLGKNEMVGFQASLRGGVVKVILRGDRVLLGGQAVTVVNGQLFIE